MLAAPEGEQFIEYGTQVLEQKVVQPLSEGEMQALLDVCDADE